MEDWSSLIFSDEVAFEEKVRQVFEYQFEYNKVYRRYCEALAVNPEILKKPAFGEAATHRQVQDDTEVIPLLPIKAFKDADVTTQLGAEPELTFKSSGTSGMQ